MSILVRNDDVVKYIIRGNVLEMDLKNQINIDYIKRLRKSISYEYFINKQRVGFLIVSIGTDKYDLIEHIYSILRGQNIGKQMIDLYKKNLKKDLIPYEITIAAVDYWYKYYSRNGMDSLASIINYLDENHLTKGDKVKWDVLIYKYMQKDFELFLANQKFKA